MGGWGGGGGAQGEKSCGRGGVNYLGMAAISRASTVRRAVSTAASTMSRTYSRTCGSAAPQHILIVDAFFCTLQSGRLDFKTPHGLICMESVSRGVYPLEVLRGGGSETARWTRSTD